MKWVILFIIAFVLVTILAPIVVVLNAIRHAWRGASLSEYFKTAAIGFDQAGGSIIYSQEDYTISSYTYYLAVMRDNEWAYRFMRVIDSIFGEGHCEESFFNEMVRASRMGIDLSRSRKDG